MILILGRFQPLHNGHMKVIEDALKQDKDIVIAIGSPGKSNQKINPFSGEERKEMIEKTLNARKLPARIFFVPDRPSDEGYVEHVLEHIRAKPDKIITENPWTIDLFTKAGYDVHITPRYFGISATEIRRRMACGEDWESMVPEQISEAVKKICGIDRIKGIHN
jgi:nicotinamide-nucleotide adenylyltransferase